MLKIPGSSLYFTRKWRQILVRTPVLYRDSTQYINTTHEPTLFFLFPSLSAPGLSFFSVKLNSSSPSTKA